MTNGENADKQLEQRVKFEEDVLDSLTTEYVNSRQLSVNRYYYGKAGACAAAFAIVFMASFVLSPYTIFLNSPKSANVTSITYTEPTNVKQANSFTDKVIFSTIMGISAGVILVMTFVVNDNLNTQRFNEKLAARSFEIRMSRSKILSLLQQQAFSHEGGTVTGQSKRKGGGDPPKPPVAAQPSYNSISKEASKVSVPEESVSKPTLPGTYTPNNPGFDDKIT